MEARESAIAKPSAPRQRSQPQPIVSESALGMVSTRSFPAIVGTADMMLKSSSVRLVGYEKIGSGYCTAVVRGRIADVRIAVEEGAAVAEQFGQFISKSVISRPLPNLEAVLPISGRLAKFLSDRGYSRLSDLAVGLLETRGFPAMVGAADAMLKAGDVQLAAYEMVGDGLCTAIIRGRVSDVAIAIQAGMHEAERIGELHAVMVIPRPLDDLEETLPVASCWIEKPVPISIPLDIKEAHKELAEQEVEEQRQEQKQEQMREPLQMPDLRQIPVDRDE